MYAFKGCIALENLIIPNSVKSLGDGAFLKCSGLKTITISNIITYLPTNLFKYCTSLTTITIPDSVTNIGSYAFANCTNINNINIPNQVVALAESTFQNCTQLSIINLNNISSIGANAFNNCTSLTTFIMPNKLISIGVNAFANCVGLTYINLPDTVTTIGASAFLGCSSMTEIIIPKSVRYIGRSAFSQCNLTIYCEAESQPYSWEFDWLEGSQSTVVWGDKSDQTIPTEPSDEIKLFMPVEDGVQGGRPFSDTTLSYDPTLGQYNPHVAVDIVAKEGKNIYAGCDGVIINIKIDDYIGGIITIDYGKGFVATFKLVADINVNIGDKVTATSIIGKVGVFQFECKQESHLHFELTKFRKQVDPMLYIISKTNY